VEEGLKRHNTMMNYFHNAPFKPDWDLLSISEFWYVDIQVSDSFSSWLMEEVRKGFPTPKTAMFKPSGKGYLIQFGTDKPVEIKSSKGLDLLYKILKLYKKKSYNIGSGYSADAINEDIINENENKTSRGSALYQKRLRNMLLDTLSKYFEVDTREDKDKFKQYCIGTTIKLNQHDNDISQNAILRILDMDKNDFIDNLESIKVWLKADPDEANKGIDSSRKNLDNALDKLKDVFPHFAYYIGPIISEKRKGLGYSGEEFYFISDDNIEWDFG